jgi:mRNA interferase MazF
LAVFGRGDVVTVPFPFSDLSATKIRPALVVATLEGTSDVILCQITSQFVRDSDAILLTADDFTEGSLRHISNVRPNRLFTADSNLILNRVGRITEVRMDVITDTIIEILRR